MFVLYFPSLPHLVKHLFIFSCPLILPVAMRMPQERLLCRILPVFFFLVSVCPEPMQILYEVSCVKTRIVEMLIQYNCWTDLVWFCTVVL